jgi:hypothetical protein
MTRYMRSGNGIGRSRADVSEAVEQTDQSLREQLEELEKSDEDVQTVRDTLSAMEFGGTSDGGEAVRVAIESTEQVGIEVFDEKDGHLDEIQDESEALQGEIEGQADADERDDQAVTDAGGRLANEETIRALDDVKRRLNEDIEFLKDHFEKAMRSEEESESKQQDHRGRVHST